MGEHEKKKVGVYVGKIISDSLKPKTQFKTQKQKKSILAQKYVAKTTKNIFFVKVPSAPPIAQDLALSLTRALT